MKLSETPFINDSTIINVRDVYDPDTIIPEGWEIDRFRTICGGDYWLNPLTKDVIREPDSSLATSYHRSPRLILRRPQRRVLRDTGETRVPVVGEHVEYGESILLVCQARRYKAGRIWHMTTEEDQP